MSKRFVFNRCVVFPWHCDQYGHMNVRWYSHFFDDGSFLSWSTIGVDMGAIVATGIHSAVVKATTEFKRETLAGTTLTLMGRFVEFGRSSVTLEQQMVHANSEQTHATSQYILVFCDSQTRQSAPIPAACREAMLAAGARERV